jgi:hypothetical protein
MFDEMSHWQRLVGTLSVSSELIMQLDSKAVQIAKTNFDNMQRKSGESNKLLGTNYYCNNSDPEICASKHYIKTLTSAFDFP